MMPFVFIWIFRMRCWFKHQWWSLSLIFVYSVVFSTLKYRTLTRTHTNTLLTMKETKILNRESASLEKKGEFIQFTEQIHLKYIGLLLMCFINKTFTTKWLNLSLFRMCSRQADHFKLCSIGFYERNVYIIIQLISCIDMWSLLFVQ